MAMNKNLTINMGNCNHRKYIPRLVDLVRNGTIEPLEVLTELRAADRARSTPTRPSTSASPAGSRSS